MSEIEKALKIRVMPSVGDGEMGFVAVRLSLSDPAQGGNVDTLGSLQHRIEGALRTVRLLAQKVIASYDSTIPGDRAKIASVEHHVATLEELKVCLVDPILMGLEELSRKGQD